MLRFKNYILSEGVVKLPPRLLGLMKITVAANFLWFARGAMNMQRKKGHDTTSWDKEINRLIKKYKATGKLPRKRFSSGPGGMTGINVPFDLSDMPASYKKILPDELDKITLAFDWGGKVMGMNKTKGAEWIPQRKVININPWAIEGFMDFAFKNPEKSNINLEYSITKAINHVEHELTHAIQDVISFATGNKKQTKLKKDYEKGGEDYYTSPVEFEAMIKSKAFEFMNDRQVMKLIKHHDTPEYTRMYLDEYLGVRKTRLVGLNGDIFFRSLKKTSKKKWKLAIKKFLSILDKQKVFDIPKNVG